MIEGEPRLLAAETDKPVDDLLLSLDNGSSVFVQAKLSIGLTSSPNSPLGKSLAQFAAAVEVGIGKGDWLVLAHGTGSRPTRALADAVARRRDPGGGGFKRDEAAALKTFEGFASSLLEEAEIERLLDALVLWETEPARGDARLALESRLDGHLVAAGQGARAARELADTVRGLAQVRGGIDARGLVAELERRSVELQPGGGAGETVRVGLALAAHRRRIVEAGRTLRVLGVSGAFGNLPLKSADAGVRVAVEEEDRSSRLGRDPGRALRRRQRALLIGEPGGGKSTALRILAATWAEKSGWPVPLEAHLLRLARSSEGLTKALLDIATEEAPGPEREALRRGLETELGEGRCLIVLDGLDEVRKGRRALVERIVPWLDAIHPDNELVVATRPVALAEAELLKFPQLELQEPDHPGQTAEAIISAASSKLPCEQREKWVTERRRWFDSALHRDSTLSSTPLAIVHTALAAARAESAESLPRGRAEILMATLRGAVSDWEIAARRRGEVSLGPLAGASVPIALTDAFRCISDAALATEPPGREKLEARLAKRLRTEFSLASGSAAAAAQEAWSFWEEAGVFAESEAGISTRVRPLAELGLGWAGVLAKNRVGWVSEIRSAPDLWPALALSAGLDAEMAALWAQGFAGDGDANELRAIKRAIDDGAELEAAGLESVARSAQGRLLTDEEEAEDAVWALIGMPLGPELRAELRPDLFAGVPKARRVLVRAFVAARWGQRTEADLVDLRRVLVAEPPPSPWEAEETAEDEKEDEEGRRVIRFPRLDNHYLDAQSAAAVILAEGGRADAELVLEHSDSERFGDPERLVRALSAGGHADLAEVVNEQLKNRYSALRDINVGDFHRSERMMVGWVAEAAPPTPLSWPQRRRLDEFVDLWETLQVKWISPQWVMKRPESLHAWFEHGARLAGFDRGVLAAEAREAGLELAEEERFSSFLFDRGIEHTLDNWAQIAEPATVAGELVGVLGHSPRQVAVRIASTLEIAPPQAEALTHLEGRLPKVKNWTRWLIAQLVIILSSDHDRRAREFSEDEDSGLRAAAAIWFSARYAHDGELESEMIGLLDDPDEEVRVDAIPNLEKGEALDEDLRRRLEELVAGEARPYRCRDCGTDAGAGEPCPDCHRSAPGFRAKARELLKEERAEASP